ncbi:MAG TPA: zinc ribbon domain-containing protein, partial [Gemmatimonadaceae bacterium]|nr:zinc ribbon domain-containing protein [Gemmatimonadaceae bacterium]
MPTYEYRCPDGHEFEKFFRTISGAPASVNCPTCGAVAARQLSGGAGLLFKGSGFYLTDYGKNAHATKGPKAASPDSGSGAGTSGSPGESKSSTGSASGSASESSGSGQSSGANTGTPGGGSSSGGSSSGGSSSGGSSTGGSSGGGSSGGGSSG